MYCAIVRAKSNCRIDTICVETRNGPSGTRPRELNKTPRLQIKYAFTITRPSALGMSDPIWGPLIHIFVDEKKKCKG